MAQALDVAKYIINSIEVDHLKLQKLTYYSQAVALVLSNGEKPLYDEEIEAWQYGPVVPEIYQEYKESGFDIIPQSCEFQENILTEPEIEAIDCTLAFYGKLSSFELVRRTHADAPWKDVYKEGQKHIIIQKETIYKFYKDKLKIA